MTGVRLLLAAALIAAGCSNGPTAEPPAAATPQASARGERPAGDSATGQADRQESPAGENSATQLTSESPATAKAIFASGCFWCTEADFDKVPGVVATVSGYIGGHVVNPTYNQVSAGGTGHVESVEVTFDPSVVTYEQLLDAYWRNVDPFNARGQFCDFGEQYRPVIWVSDAAQRASAETSMARIEKSLGRSVAVTVEDAERFYPAETYHQDYYKKNPVRYNYYRWGCGRDARLAEVWGKD